MEGEGFADTGLEPAPGSGNEIQDVYGIFLDGELGGGKILSGLSSAGISLPLPSTNSVFACTITPSSRKTLNSRFDVSRPASPLHERSSVAKEGGPGGFLVSPPYGWEDEWG